MSTTIKSRIGVWFRTYWPQKTMRDDVLRQYQSLQQKPLFLQDIALRGSIFQPIPPGPYAERMEGRRQLALEIIAISGMDWRVLHDLVNQPLTYNNGDIDV
jgi:hypothetical protein